MTMLMILSCPCRSVSSVHDFNSNLKISARTKCVINSSFGTAFPRSRVSQRIFWYKSASCSQGIGWSRWMGRQEALMNFGGVRGRRVVEEEARLGTRWNRETVRSDMFTTPNSGHNSCLGKFLKFDKSRGDGESQKTAVVDVHIRFSLSEPKSLADAVSRLAPPWFKLLKRVQPVLPLLLQNGGGGNRDGDLYSRLGYGGDDDSDESKANRLRKERLLSVYQWWAVGVALTALVVWAMRAYSGISRRPQFSVSQCVDGVFWLGLMWCIAVFFLWTVRMLVSLTPSGQGSTPFRTPNAYSFGREFVLASKFDEWMAQNVVAVPGLIISLFLVCDLIHYGKNLNLVSRVKPDLSRIFPLFKSPSVGGAPRPASLFSIGLSAEKRSRGTSSSAKWRRP